MRERHKIGRHCPGQTGKKYQHDFEYYKQLMQAFFDYGQKTFYCLLLLNGAAATAIVASLKTEYLPFIHWFGGGALLAVLGLGAMFLALGTYAALFGDFGEIWGLGSKFGITSAICIACVFGLMSIWCFCFGVYYAVGLEIKIILLIGFIGTVIGALYLLYSVRKGIKWLFCSAIKGIKWLLCSAIKWIKRRP